MEQNEMLCIFPVIKMASGQRVRKRMKWNSPFCSIPFQDLVTTCRNTLWHVHVTFALLQTNTVFPRVVTLGYYFPIMSDHGLLFEHGLLFKHGLLLFQPLSVENLPVRARVGQYHSIFFYTTVVLSILPQSSKTALHNEWEEICAVGYCLSMGYYFCGHPGTWVTI